MHTMEFHITFTRTGQSTVLRQTLDFDTDEVTVELADTTGAFHEVTEIPEPFTARMIVS